MKIKEICEYGNKSKIKAREALSEGKVKFFTSSAESNRYINEEQFTSPGIIMGTGGNATLHYCDESFAVSTDCLVLFPKRKVSTKYLYYFFKGNFQILQEGFRGAGLKHTSKKYIDEISINHIPNDKEQNQVVNILDKLNDTIIRKQQQLSQYDLLIKSRFVEIFESFDKTDLSNIAEINMGQSPESSYYNVNGAGLPFFQGKADFGAKYTKVSYWTTKPTKTAKKGNVLMSVRAPVGPVNISSVDCCIGRGLCSIDAIQDKTNNEFLYNALIAIQDKISAMGTGSTFKAINKSDVYSIQLPLAPISLQNDFATFVQQIDKLKFSVQKSLEETQTLFDSLMQKYFG
jgi:type I restriction enzyme S subunit